MTEHESNSFVDWMVLTGRYYDYLDGKITLDEMKEVISKCDEKIVTCFMDEFNLRTLINKHSIKSCAEKTEE